jgi:hypothetical protein
MRPGGRIRLFFYLFFLKFHIFEYQLRNWNNMRKSPIDIILDHDAIDRRREAIRSGFLAPGPPKVLSAADIERLFLLYDEYYFDGYIRSYMGRNIRFRVSRRMTRSAGKTLFNAADRSCEITVSLPLISDAFRNGRTEVKINGLPTRSRTEALMSVMEHELVHLLEFMLFGRSSCRGKRFRAIAFGLFGHRDIYHELCHSESPQVGYSFRPGDRVIFRYRNVSRKGIISRITKRATVMVRHKRGTFSGPDGGRYVKYYVPLNMLAPLENRLFD